MTAPENFRDHLRQIVNPADEVKLQINGNDARWLATAKDLTGVPQTDYINDAITVAGIQQLASECGMNAIAADDIDRVYELPFGKVPDFDATTVNFKVYVTSENQNMLHWMEARDISKNETVHRGIRVLGHIAMTPATKIITSGVNQDYAYSLPRLPRIAF